MSLDEVDMASLDDRDLAVLRAMKEGRANPLLVRERTDLDKGDVNTVLVRLGRGGYVEQVTRGLYEITEKGRDELRNHRAERKAWLLHDQVTDSDLERFPEKANELSQEGNYKWYLLGVTDDGRAYYFDKVEMAVCNVTEEDGELVEQDRTAIEERAAGESFADSLTTYIALQRDEQTWDRWSRYGLALSFAREMEKIAPQFMSNKERIGYSFNSVFDLSTSDVLVFLDIAGAGRNEFNDSALRKLETSHKLRTWLGDLGLPQEGSVMANL